MKVLRVAMTYPRDIEQGVGQHAFYHALHSDNEEMIITSKRPGKMLENREGVRLVEIDFENVALGKYSESKLKRAGKFIKKAKSQKYFLDKAKAYIDEFKPEIVHLYSPIPILCGMYAKRKYGSRMVISLHGSDALRISRNPIFKSLLNKADAVVSVSESMEEQLKEAGFKGEVKCIGNGVDLNTFACKDMDRKKQFVHVGNLRWQKGQEYLIKAFHEFSKVIPGYTLIIIGAGEREEELKALAKELELSDSIIFTGSKSREYVAETMNESEAFILTSVTEGFPKVIIEAMATGTPVISTDVGNVKNVVSGAGIVVPSLDVDGIAEAMQELVRDKEKWTKCSEEGLMLSRNYSWSKNQDRLQSIYEELL